MTASGSLRTLASDPWDGVFEEVQLTVVPLQFLKSVVIEFTNTKSWELKITNDIRSKGWKHLTSLLEDISMHYKNNLQNIEFLIDTKKVKKSVEQAKRSFLKKRLI